MFSVQMSCWHLAEQSWPFSSRLQQKFSAWEFFPEPDFFSFRRLLKSPVFYTQVMVLCSLNIKLMRLSQNILIQFPTNQCSHICVSTEIFTRTNFNLISHYRLVSAFETGEQVEDSWEVETSRTSRQPSWSTWPPPWPPGSPPPWARRLMTSWSPADMEGKTTSITFEFE